MARQGFGLVSGLSRLFMSAACRGLFHKTFFFVIYGHFAVNYGIFTIYEQIYGQNLAVTTNP